MRAVNTAAAALLARLQSGERIPLVQLIELQLASTTLRYTTAGISLSWSGVTWLSVGGSVEPMDFKAGGDVDTMVMTLPGVTETDLAVALAEPLEGRPALIYDALVDPDTGAVAQAVLGWSGTLNVPTVADGPVASVTLSAEHTAITARRPKVSRYTDDEQQRLHAGDISLHFDPATDALPLPWPAAAAFAQ